VCVCVCVCMYKCWWVLMTCVIMYEYMRCWVICSCINGQVKLVMGSIGKITPTSKMVPHACRVVSRTSIWIYGKWFILDFGEWCDIGELCEWWELCELCESCELCRWWELYTLCGICVLLEYKWRWIYGYIF